ELRIDASNRILVGPHRLGLRVPEEPLQAPQVGQQAMCGEAPLDLGHVPAALFLDVGRTIARPCQKVANAPKNPAHEIRVDPERKTKLAVRRLRLALSRRGLGLFLVPLDLRFFPCDGLPDDALPSLFRLETGFLEPSEPRKDEGVSALEMVVE